MRVFYRPDQFEATATFTQNVNSWAAQICGRLNNTPHERDYVHYLVQSKLREQRLANSV